MSLSKRFGAASVGLLLIATPALAFAQVSSLTAGCSSAPTVACLQAEIQQLVQILTQLLAAHHKPTPSYPSSATIDQSSLTENTGTFSITGESTGAAAADGVLAFLAPGTYTYSTDYNTVWGQAAKNGFYQSILTGTKDSGQWSAEFGTVNTGTYMVFVYDTVSHALLTQDTLTVTNGGNTGLPSATITTSLTQNAGSFLMNGTAQNTSSVVVGVYTPSESGQYFGSGGIPVINGSWAVTIPSLAAGTYKVTVNDGQAEPAGSSVPVGGLLVASTLTVGGSNSSAGTLTVTNPIPLPYQIVAGGTTSVTVGSFTLQPSGEPMSLQQITLDIPGFVAMPYADIPSASIWQGSTIIGTVHFSRSIQGCPGASANSGIGCYFATSTVSNVSLPQNQATTFTIKADFAGIGVGQAGTAGDNLTIQLADAAAVGNNSGAVYHSGALSSPTIIRVFKSYPTFTLIQPPSTTITGNQQSLLRFSITASASGPVGIGVLSFMANGSSVSLSNVQLSAYTDSGYSQAIAGSKVGVVAPTANPSLGTEFTLSPTTPIEIPAGSTYYFDVSGAATAKNNASLSVTLEGDTSYLFGASGIAVGSNMIWSPNDNGISQEGVTSDWTNGYGLPGLPSVGITQVMTGNGGSPTPTPTPTQASVSLSASSVAAGGNISVSANDSNANSGVWVGLYPQGVSPTQANLQSTQWDWVYMNTCSTTRGTASTWGDFCSLPIPSTLAAGSYYVELFGDSTYGQPLAQSSSFTVTNSSSPATPSSPVSVSPSSISAGGTASVTWNYPQDSDLHAWLALIPQGSSPVQSSVQLGGWTWVYLNSCSKTVGAAATPTGACSVAIPSSIASGTYVFQLFGDDTYGNPVAQSGPFTVTASGSAANTSSVYTAIQSVLLGMQTQLAHGH